jgi:replicative DNA helicase
MEDSNKKSLTTRKNLKMSPLHQLALDHGKLPPQAVELEEAVLGAMMLEKDAVNDVIDILKPESFYKEQHQKIYAAIQDLFQRSEPIDILTVTSELKKRGELEFVGGPFYITSLTNRIASSANAEFYARIISQKHIQRELIRISSKIIQRAYDETTDVFDLLDEAEKDLFTIAEGNIRKNFLQIKDIMHEALQNIENAKKHEDAIIGVPSGFTALDRVTAGWQKSDLIVIAARPGMGKTAFVLTMARNAAVEFNKPVAFFSLEMSAVQLVTRLIASETEIEAEKLKRGNLADYEWEQLHAKIGALSKAPLFIDDTPALSIFELRAKCRRLKAQHDIQLIIIDYLQLMTTGGEKGSGNREQEISMISRSLKSIAKELNIPVIALSQLSRAVENRSGDKRPQLSDLRESGAIEQDADLVAFIYRPEYYGFTQDKEGNSVTGLAYILIQKHRNGALQDVPLRFVNKLAKFMDVDNHPFDSLAPLTPSNDFESGVTYTLPSKLNDWKDDDEGNLPF